jgi:hypothetical protein
MSKFLDQVYWPILQSDQPALRVSRLLKHKHHKNENILDETNIKNNTEIPNFTTKITHSNETTTQMTKQKTRRINK